MFLKFVYSQNRQHETPKTYRTLKSVVGFLAGFLFRERSQCAERSESIFGNNYMGGGELSIGGRGPRRIIYATVRLTGCQLQGLEALRLMETT